MSITEMYINGMPKQYRCDGCGSKEEPPAWLLRPEGWIEREQPAPPSGLAFEGVELVCMPMIKHFCPSCQEWGKRVLEAPAHSVIELPPGMTMDQARDFLTK